MTPQEKDLLIAIARLVGLIARATNGIRNSEADSLDAIAEQAK